jgi:malonate transporter
MRSLPPAAAKLLDSQGLARETDHVEMLALILPIFAVMVTGFVFRQLEIVPESLAESLIQFAFYVAVPALLILVIGQEPVEKLARWRFYVGFGGAVAVTFVAIVIGARLWRGRGLAEATMLAFVCTAANTGFVAIPVLHASIGHRAVLPAAIATIIMVGLVLVALVLLEAAQPAGPDEQSTWPQVERTLKNPVILASAVGVAWSIGGLGFPAVVSSYLDLLGDALAPCALFAIGMSLRLQAVRGDAFVIALCATVKLLVVPLFVMLLVRWLELEPVFAISAVVCAAVPTAKISYVLANQYHVEKELVSEVISVTTSLSVLTLVGWLFLLGHLYHGVFTS